jgi:MATE family multidrug resistance protein
MSSPQEVAAALPAGVLSFTLTSFFLALSSYTATVVAQYFGKGDSASCVKAAWNGFYLSLGTGLLVLLVMPWLGLGLIEFSGHAPEIRALERDYFITLIPSGAFMCMSAALISLFTGVGRTRHAAFVNLTSCALNVVLDYMLIFGKWGAPVLGIRGAGIATSLATACTFFWRLCFSGFRISLGIPPVPSVVFPGKRFGVSSGSAARPGCRFFRMWGLLPHLPS